MTEKLTWKEFAEKYKPKDGDTFLDHMGNEWVFKKQCFTLGSFILVSFSNAAEVLICPLIPPKAPPKAKRKLWPAIVKYYETHELTQQLFESEEDARSETFDRFILWPAVQSADGSYEVDE